MSINLKPSTSVVYPPFKNGMYMEEFFDKFWQNEQFPLKNNFIYLDIYWHNLFNQYNGNCNIVMSQITKYIIDFCVNAANNNKIVFTVCQWDDGIQLQCTKPKNLIIFSVGGSNNKNDNAINLPLIIQDVSYRLCDVKKKKLDDKEILASFIGTSTNWVRDKMFEQLKNNKDFKFIIKNGWSINVPEDKVTIFIDTTLKSKFGLAPRGYGNSSFRFFEIMELGVIPVYIHDDDNGLPYLDILDYSKFAIIIHINDISKLPDILNKITDDEYKKMLTEMKKVKLWFTPFGICNYIREYLVQNFII
jgi:hypothetical protein